MDDEELFSIEEGFDAGEWNNDMTPIKLVCLHCRRSMDEVSQDTRAVIQDRNQLLVSPRGQMTEKERLMHSLETIEDHLCENPPRIGDALFIVECIKATLDHDSDFAVTIDRQKQIITICGINYAFDLFRGLGFKINPEAFFQVVERGDGVVTIRETRHTNADR